MAVYWNGIWFYSGLADLMQTVKFELMEFPSFEEYIEQGGFGLGAVKSRVKGIESPEPDADGWKHYHWSSTGRTPEEAVANLERHAQFMSRGKDFCWHTPPTSVGLRVHAHEAHCKFSARASTTAA
jgi:hypothetical protein